MADLDDLPDLVDGADPATTGTPVDEDFWDDVETALVGECRGATDPTRTPAQTTEEVLTARGNLGSLNARVSGVVDPDGNPIGLVLPAMLRNGFVHGNLLANDTFMMWSRGVAAAPDFWTLSGTGAAVARCGVGQSDTTVLSGMDHFSAKITYGSTAAVLKQVSVNVAMSLRMAQGILNRYHPVDNTNVAVPGYGDLDAFNIYLIGHAKTTTANAVRLRVGTSSSADSPYHPADGNFHTLIAGPLEYNVGISTIDAQCRVEAAGSAYFQCLSLVLMPTGFMPMYVPSLVVRDSYHIKVVGNPASATLDFIMPDGPIFVLGAQMACVTAPTTSAPTVDLLTPIGGAFASLFATLPNIAVTKVVGTFQACDVATANDRRCTIRGLPTVASAALQDNSILKVVYVDDGGNTLQDLIVTIHYLRYARPFEQFRAMGEIGE